MFTCPACKSDCKLLIMVGNTFKSDNGKLKCENCHSSTQSSDPGLHDIVAKNEQCKITKGKAWEIRHRIKSPDDGHTCINSKTGKPTQF